MAAGHVEQVHLHLKAPEGYENRLLKADACLIEVAISTGLTASFCQGLVQMLSISSWSVY